MWTMQPGGRSLIRKEARSNGPARIVTKQGAEFRQVNDQRPRVGRCVACRVAFSNEPEHTAAYPAPRKPLCVDMAVACVLERRKRKHDAAKMGVNNPPDRQLDRTGMFYHKSATPFFVFTPRVFLAIPAAVKRAFAIPAAQGRATCAVKPAHASRPLANVGNVARPRTTAGAIPQAPPSGGHFRERGTLLRRAFKRRRRC